MEIFPAANDDAWTLIRHVIDESDYYLLVIAGKYDSVDPGSGLSYTEMEYDCAHRAWPGTPASIAPAHTLIVE